MRLASRSTRSNSWASGLEWAPLLAGFKSFTTNGTLSSTDAAKTWGASLSENSSSPGFLKNSRQLSSKSCPSFSRSIPRRCFSHWWSRRILRFNLTTTVTTTSRCSTWTINRMPTWSMSVSVKTFRISRATTLIRTGNKGSSLIPFQKFRRKSSTSTTWVFKCFRRMKLCRGGSTNIWSGAFLLVQSRTTRRARLSWIVFTIK